MSDHVYRLIELAGSSPDSIEDAVANAIAAADSALGTLRWFQVMETRGHIEQGRVAHYQVVVKIGYTVQGAISV